MTSFSQADLRRIRSNLEYHLGLLKQTPTSVIDLTWFKAETPCGTLFCSLGIAAESKYFRELGLKWSHKFDNDPKPRVVCNDYADVGYDGLDRIFGLESFNALFETRGSGTHDDIAFAAAGGEWDGDGEGYRDPGPEALTDKALAISRVESQIEWVDAQLQVNLPGGEA